MGTPPIPVAQQRQSGLFLLQQALQQRRDTDCHRWLQLQTGAPTDRQTLQKVPTDGQV